MKILVDYDSVTGNITMDNGMQYFTGIGLNPKEAQTGQDKILDLIKNGLTADDLVKLKNMDIL